MSRKKVFIYVVLLMVVILLNVAYFRTTLLDHWLRYNVNDEFITVSSLIEPNSDDSNIGRLEA